MTGPPILFAGPSLWGTPLPPAIDLRPPARCGDILRAAAARPSAIGLVDGVFEQGPSVWHKEILAVLAAGIPVWGAASLGALRAAEVAGMTGIGEIYAGYRDGRLTRDDAVMVSHAPAALGHRPLTLALVDAEAALDACAMAAADRTLLRRIATAMNFRDRTWPAIAAAFHARTGRPSPAWDETASLKRRDAMALVARLTRPPAALLPPPVVPPPPETVFLRALRARVAGDAIPSANAAPDI
ncbi:TfuA-like protein [Sphingomonas solaris]|uniref:Transcriptional regulator n=1 Tax=Alterirhizorhabdus solaris TaxID=2529389 RepID=A0A558R7P8_9SPHN|nr:TfuA-like protein [Sphingomonas solaris]TVV75376.1 transcriptional regulator [Sphingomonas solaris]